MFYRTAIVLAVTICATNAALIVSVHDDVGQEALSSEDSCDYQACDQLCRRLGFPGGACVGDRCKCDNFKQSQGLETTNSIADVDTCEDSFCNTLCQDLGFTDGSCVNGQCKCERKEVQNTPSEIQRIEQIVHSPDEDNELPVNDKVTTDRDVLGEELPEVNIRTLVSRGSCDCNPRNCDVYCFRIHYTGGICVTGQCRCYK